MRKLVITNNQITDSEGCPVAAELIYKYLEENFGAKIRKQLPNLRFRENPINAFCLSKTFFRFTPTFMLCDTSSHNHRIDPLQDQVIVNNKWWFGIRSESLITLNTILSRKELSYGNITFKQYVSLLTDPDIALHVLDESCETAKFSDWDLGEYQALPSGLEVEQMHPFQEVGQGVLRIFSGHDMGCLLADEMGLGNSSGDNFVTSYIRERSSLVVAPASLLMNWKKELEKFAPSLTTHVHAGK